MQVIIEVYVIDKRTKSNINKRTKIFTTNEFIPNDKEIIKYVRSIKNRTSDHYNAIYIGSGIRIMNISCKTD